MAYLGRTKIASVVGPGESESLGYLGKNKIASVMTLGESESLGILEE